MCVKSWFLWVCFVCYECLKVLYIYMYLYIYVKRSIFLVCDPPSMIFLCDFMCFYVILCNICVYFVYFCIVLCDLCGILIFGVFGYIYASQLCIRVPNWRPKLRYIYASQLR